MKNYYISNISIIYKLLEISGFAKFPTLVIVVILYHTTTYIYNTLQQRGATTGIDYIVLYEGYLKLIMSGIHHGKTDFINIIQQWDEAVFPETEMSIVARKSSTGGENEINREIERMEMEDKDNE
jgi:hypothetical protein